MSNQKKIPIHKAVALSYKEGFQAPKVVAKGSGFVAEKIIEKGTEADIPVYEDATLVDELSKIDLGENIPPELYEVVAQILIFISDLDKLEAYKAYGK